MLPVAILRHAPTEGPGYFAIFLEEHGIPWRLIAVDEGEAIPANADQYAGLCLMGGPMSVNDPLPWIEPVCDLIRDAVAKNIPTLGHCLGGQLMSKALGGQITRNPIKEIGWSDVLAETGETARRWLGEHAGKPATVFQWHGETFSLPAGATRLLANAHCANQMFALGPHLGMQCHVEMTEALIRAWCHQWHEEVSEGIDRSAIQTPQQMADDTAAKLPAMRKLANQLYRQWISALPR